MPFAEAKEVPRQLTDDNVSKTILTEVPHYRTKKPEQYLLELAWSQLLVVVVGFVQLVVAAAV